MSDKREYMRCPMMKDNIDIGYCIELQMIAGKEVKPTREEAHLTDRDWEICRNCIKQRCPTPDIISADNEKFINQTVKPIHYNEL